MPNKLYLDKENPKEVLDFKVLWKVNVFRKRNLNGGEAKGFYLTMWQSQHVTVDCLD